MKKSKQKNVVILSIYKKKTVNIKPYVMLHTNKDGTQTRYGVSKQGHRFKEKILRNFTEKELTKEFKKAQSIKDRRTNNVTGQLIRYEGTFYGKTKLIKGKQTAKYFYNIDKKKYYINKEGLKTSYTYNINEIINQIEMIEY